MTTLADTIAATLAEHELEVAVAVSCLQAGRIDGRQAVQTLTALTGRCLERFAEQEAQRRTAPARATTDTEGA